MNGGNDSHFMKNLNNLEDFYERKNIPTKLNESQFPKSFA